MFNNNKGEFRPFPYEIRDVDPATNADLVKNFTGEKTGFVQVGPEKYFFPYKFKTSVNELWNFAARPDDIWICTFPRSGTTWTQEMVWMIANNLDYKGAQDVPLYRRSPFFEFHLFMHDKTREDLMEKNAGDLQQQNFINEVSAPGYQFLPHINGRRFIKTHLPFSLLPPSIMECGAKIIYVARNPRDVAVSYYHLNRLWVTQGYHGDFPKYWDYFERDLTPWAPYWSHIKEGWTHKHLPNVLFMFYEDMNRNLSSTIRTVANFLDAPVPEKDIPKLVDYLSIESFKVNPAVNMKDFEDAQILNRNEQSFVRRGKSGGWQNEYTPEIIEKVEAWTEKNLNNTDMRFSQH